MALRERWRRKLGIMLGLAAYVGLVAVMLLSTPSDGRHLMFGEFRIRATSSDLGILTMLFFAGPGVIWASFANWRR